MILFQYSTIIKQVAANVHLNILTSKINFESLNRNTIDFIVFRFSNFLIKKLILYKVLQIRNLQLD